MRKLLFWVARSRFAGWFIGFTFAHLTHLMPLKRLYEDAECILFLHPKRHWRTHWLGVPKRAVASFAVLDWRRDGVAIVAILRYLTHLARSLDGAKAIIVNGGGYQDVPQLHFHLAHGGLVSGDVWVEAVFVAGGVVVSAENQITIQQIDPTHWQVVNRQSVSLEHIAWGDSAETELLMLLQATQSFVKAHQFTAYTVQFYWDDIATNPCLVAHIFASV